MLYTWLFNHTRGSVLLAYLFHASANTWSMVFPVDHANDYVGWTVTGLLFLLALVVVVTNGAENLARRTERIREV